jgi:SAM-dependent methyltransferase
MSTDLPWYDRFFQREYLNFDDHPNTDVEVAFVTRTLAISQDVRILDLACGYGRHALPLSQRAQIFGLDRSGSMLSAARERSNQTESPSGPFFVRSDVRTLPFPDESFDAVISLFSSIGYFETEDENFRVLRNIADALRPNGRFLLETVNREFIIRHSAPQQVYHPEGMLLIEERTFDPISGRSHVDVTVVEDGNETRLWHSIRVYTFTEIEMLLQAVGLRPLDVWGDYQSSPYTCDSEHMIVLSEKV